MTEKLRPFRPVTPGEILKEELDARGWTQSDFAEILGRPIQAVNEIISGKKAVVPATAVELSRAIGTSPEFWLNLESAYRLDLLHHEGRDNEQIARRAKVYSLVPVKEAAKRGWIRKSKNLDIIEREVCRLLDIDSVDDKPALAVAARKSDPYGALSPGQVAWACRARQIARKKKVKPFDHRRFNTQVASLVELSVDADGVARVPKALANLGVRLVVVEHLPQTYIDGAAFWLDAKSPVVAMSLRYDRIDCFWFTLMHELAHIKEGGRHGGHLDRNLVGPSAEAREDKPKEEQEADDQACEWLVPPDEVDAFVAKTKPYFSKAAIMDFAESMAVHPGIVIGRLQYLGMISYSHSRAMLVKVRERLMEAAG